VNFTSRIFIQESEKRSCSRLRVQLKFCST